jgi:hypothetical protein
MPKTRTREDGKRSRAAKALLRKRGPAPRLFLESTVGAIGAQDVLSDNLGAYWGRLKRMVESDIQRVKAYTSANYDEQTRRWLAICAADAEWPIRQADVLVELLQSLLEAIQAALGAAQGSLDRGGREQRKGQGREGPTEDGEVSVEAQPAPAAADSTMTSRSAQAPCRRP